METSNLVKTAFIGLTSAEVLTKTPAVLMFQVHSIRELALFQPYQAALNILNDTFFPENNKNYDPESPQELLPKMGDFPTERVPYTTLVMDKIAEAPGESDGAPWRDNLTIEAGCVQIFLYLYYAG